MIVFKYINDRLTVRNAEYKLRKKNFYAMKDSLIIHGYETPEEARKEWEERKRVIEKHKKRDF